jgi:hypothetical protein
VDAWTINNGFSVADSFTLSSASTITSFTAGLWLSPGDKPTGTDWAIVSLGSPTLFPNGTLWAGGTAAAFSNVYFGISPTYGYDLYNSTVSGLSVSLNPGTYYLELFNATTSIGNPVYWDENDGPSTAYENEIGLLNGSSNPAGGSQAFTIYGSTPTSATPEPGTMLMFGTGILGLAGAVRRRFCI